MDARVSKFRLHLRRMAGSALPSYADCLGRGPRVRRAAAPRLGVRARTAWVAATR